METAVSINDPPEVEYAEHLRVLDERLGAALQAAGADALAVFAGREKTIFRDDATYPFKVEPYFKAWLPLTTAAGSWLLLEPGRRPVLVHLQETGFWHAPPRDPQGFWTQHFDIRRVGSDEEARTVLRPFAAHAAVIGDCIPDELAFRSVNDPALLAHLDYFRAAKTAYEVRCMARAAAIAVRGHLAAGAGFGPGVSELELHQRYCTATAQREIDLPYSNIVALNEHACVLHYQHLDREPPRIARSFLLDAGATYQGYASDITRTWTRDEWDFAALVAAMEAMQQALCAEARAGVDFVALNEQAHERLAGVLAEHGVVSCTAEEAHARGITRTFLPHGLGHLLGLQVHDAGGHLIAPDGERRAPPPEHPSLRLTRVLEPGFAVTIEPGLYFIPLLLDKLRATAAADAVNWPLVERLLPFGGIRIEDDVVVTDGAPKNLSREAFARA